MPFKIRLDEFADSVFWSLKTIRKSKILEEAISDIQNSTKDAPEKQFHKFTNIQINFHDPKSGGIKKSTIKNFPEWLKLLAELETDLKREKRDINIVKFNFTIRNLWEYYLLVVTIFGPIFYSENKLLNTISPSP